jgi:hypothetical protein
MTRPRARDRLNAAARQELRWAGITAPGWARWCGWQDGQWHGDLCGCPDDRCMDGYHHDPYERCGCLDALLAQRARGATHHGDYGPNAYYLTGRR